jgi:mRNA-degrading endonuclease RelE of RelBE toxin-antitoxin system
VLSRVIFLLILLSSTISFASNCLMAEALKDPKLAQNGKFWEEYSGLAAKGEVPYDQMQALISKHGGLANSKSVPDAKTFKKSISLEVQHKAEKEIKALPKSLKDKVDEFLELALKPGGMQEVRNNPGRWRLEKLHDGTHTVRLNDGHRIRFQEEGDSLVILRVNADQIHKQK